jgi:F-type H+-transporting ATPase subunit epsilon
MELRVLVPFQIFAQKTGVMRIVAESLQGSFGLLPNRLDCVAALVPGILVYQTPADGTVYIAVDEGVLVKCGTEVLVSVRRASGGKELAALHEEVIREYLQIDSRERAVRSAVSKMEGSLMGRLSELGHER